MFRFVETARTTFPIGRNGLLSPIEVPVTVSPTPVLTSVAQPNQSLLEQVIPASGSTSKSKQKTVQNRNGTAAKKHNMLSPSNYHALNPSADLKLPAEIFASDDSVSDAGVVVAEDVNVQNVLQEALLNSDASNTKDKMLGGINIKVEVPDSVKVSKKTKSKSNTTNLKLESIKTELQDDLDWNNMTLATVNNNIDTNKYSM